MSLKFKNHSPRAQWWDYHTAASYFITICTKDKFPYFGKLKNKQVELSEIGEIVLEEWLKTTTIRPDMNLHLGEFVIMPDHFHAIITIGMNEYNFMTQCITDENGTFISFNAFQPQRKNLGAIIRGFKGVVTIRAREIDPNFRWHKLYHDVIIQSSESYHRIEEYIRLNPTKG